MLPAACLAQNPYSDAAFRTFISVSVNGTNVAAKLTFLNITYFRQINESKIAEIEKKVNKSRNTSDLYQVGNYSNDSFTAEILPVNDTRLNFTFEGQPVMDASGNVICNETRTDENGTAWCDIKYFRDSVNGAKRNLEDYKSCGYATVKSEAKGNLPSASQTVTVCPGNAYALTAFAGAIQSEIGSNLAVCFPAMLIAGLLVAAMYYSGRDPLSLFDITTPKLPKTPSFKVKMQTSPQMLRQVQRRYMMIKKQARRDSVREVARLARKSGMSVAEARREMNALYDMTEAKMRNKLSDDELLAIRTKWAGLMEKYKPAVRDGALEARFRRSIDFSSGLHQAYLQSHQALAAMAEARGKTSKGGLWSRNVSKPLIDKLAKASVDFEESKVGKALGRIPLVKRVVAAPSKALDVSSQLRGSRQSLKAIRGEMLGQVATMLGQTRLGRPVYNAFRGAHVAADGKTQTRFGKAYTFLTGRDWRRFVDKHDLATKRLVEYYNVIASMRQHGIDVHNRTFDEIASKLICALPIRANEMQKFAVAMGIKGATPEETAALIARLGNTTALDALFERLRENLKGSGKKGQELVDELAKAMGTGALKEDDRRELAKRLDKIQAIINGLKGADREHAENMLAQLKEAIKVERELAGILDNKESNRTHGSILDEMVKLVDRHSKDEPGRRKEDIDHIRDAVARFKAAEETLRERMLVYLDGKNYYQIVEKKDLRSDIAQGMSDEKLRAKYGENIVELLGSGADARAKNYEIFRQMLGIREAGTGENLKRAIDGFMAAIGAASLTADERRMLSQIASDFGGKKSLTDSQMAKISERMDAMDTLRLKVDGRVFGKLNDAEAKMKTWMLGAYNNKNEWILGKNIKDMMDSYKGIGDIFNNRLEDEKERRAKKGETLELHEIAREGSALGKNPLELVIEKALRDAIAAKAIETAKANGMTQEEARAYAKSLGDEMIAIMREKNGKMKDMDSLEQFFKKATGGEAHSEEFAKFLRKVSP